MLRACDDLPTAARIRHVTFFLVGNVAIDQTPRPLNLDAFIDESGKPVWQTTYLNTEPALSARLSSTIAQCLPRFEERTKDTMMSTRDPEFLNVQNYETLFRVDEESHWGKADSTSSMIHLCAWPIDSQFNMIWLDQQAHHVHDLFEKLRCAVLHVLRSS